MLGALVPRARHLRFNSSHFAGLLPFTNPTKDVAISQDRLIDFGFAQRDSLEQSQLLWSQFEFPDGVLIEHFATLILENVTFEVGRVVRGIRDDRVSRFALKLTLVEDVLGCLHLQETAFLHGGQVDECVSHITHTLNDATYIKLP